MKTRTYLFALLAIILLVEMRCKDNGTKVQNSANLIVNREDSLLNDWDIFIKALIYVESRGKWDAVSSKNAVGVLQETKVLLDDANRILGENRYELNDRLDSLKSVEIFNVIQGYYNPDKDKHLALKVWNPRSKLSYHTAVINKYNELKNE